MDGVMMPDISAGSNHVGARDTCTPQVSCPSGPVALAGNGDAIVSARATSARICRRVLAARLAPRERVPRQRMENGTEMNPACKMAMAFPLRPRMENAGYVSHPRRTKGSTPCATDNFLFCLRSEPNETDPALGFCQSTHYLPGCPGVSVTGFPAGPIENARGWDENCLYVRRVQD